MADSSINAKTKKKADAKKKAKSDQRKEKEIKTDIFEEEYRFQWVNHH
jgi:hypothetical protein